MGGIVWRRYDKQIGDEYISGRRTGAATSGTRATGRSFNFVVTVFLQVADNH